MATLREAAMTIETGVEGVLAAAAHTSLKQASQRPRISGSLFTPR